MYKLELKKNKKRINSVDDWKEFAPPKNPNVQWKDGRSAKELAKYIINGNGYIPKEIEDILLDLGCNTNSIFYGEPEAITSLAGRGGGRNHDLLLVQENEVVVGIEAKSDESLGSIVYKELFEGVSDNKFTRINSLYNDIYGYDLYKNMDIRYQLLTATVGILKEAQKFKASKAVLIILTLKKENCYDLRRVKSNIQDVNIFINSLGSPLKNGQYNLPGYPNIDFYIKHIELDIK
ncbi:MAG: hypothetical protein MSH12_01365 [Romboutsia timonensis]|nr:hypothetical protein [Romboutsia timonensis]